MLSMDLTGKTALVAGSSQGIGLATAQALSSLGAACVLFARNEEALRQALTTLDTAKGQRHQYLVADFNRPEQVEAVIKKFAETQAAEILVNNSGGPAAGPAAEALPEAFEQAFRQHLICNHLITTCLIPGMKQAAYGRIINIISTSVKIPLKNLGVSNTIRGAVASWSKTLANELAIHGITVNNVLPGATATARLEAILAGKMSRSGISKEAAEQEMTAEIPAGRFGRPEEIAAVAAFLATPAAVYINGVNIPVDGGRTGCL